MAIWPYNSTNPKVGWKISYINARTVCVCLSPVRSWEQNVVLPRFFCRHKEILLASSTNCFSSLYDMWLERKVFATFWQVMHWRPCMYVTLPGYRGQDESCPPLECHWNILEGHGYNS